MKYLISLFLMVVLLPSIGMAQDSIDYGDYLHWVTGSAIPQDFTRDTAVFGSNLYCADPSGICIYRLESGTSEYLGMISKNLASSRLSVTNGLLIADSYVNLSDPSALHIYDLGDPDNPQLMETIVLPSGSLSGLASNGRYVFVGTSNDEILVFDLSEDPSSQPVGQLAMDLNGCNFFTLVDDLLVVGSNYDHRLIDCSDPRNLVESSIISGYFSSVVGGNGLLYFSGWDPTLAIWDISDPLEPHEISSTEIVMSLGRDIQVQDGFAYIANDYNSGGILTIDITNPTSPQYVSETRVRQESRFVDLMGNWAIATGRLPADHSRFDIFDISNPHPAPMVSYWVPGYVLFNAVSIEETTGYFSDLISGTIWIVDLSDVQSPVLLAEINSFELIPSLESGPGWLAVTDWSSEIQFFDTEIPSDPVLTGTIPLPPGSKELVYGDGFLAVTLFEDPGIILIDMSDITEPTIISELWGIGSCSSSQFQGQTLFTAGDHEIRAIDYSNPQEPAVRVIGEYPEGTCHLAVKGGRVFSASFSYDDYQGTLRVFDGEAMDGPEPPLEEYQIPVAGDLLIADQTLYMRSYAALWAFDIQNGCQIIGNGPPVYNSSNSIIADFTTIGPYILGTTGSGGLAVFYRQDQLSTSGLDTSVSRPGFDFIDVYPNPFNPRTTVSFDVDQSRNVRVEVFDLRGRFIAELADQLFESGEHSVEWQGRNDAGRTVPSGEYFFRVEMGGKATTKKAMLVR